MRPFFIVNPVAHGGKSLGIWSGIQRHLMGRGFPWDAVFTEGPGHAVKIASSASERGIKRVFAVGGDGTVQEVANGLAGSDVTLAPVPAGRGNDFARALGLPRNPLLALRVGLEGFSRCVDLGWVEVEGLMRYFLNISSTGFDAEVARAAAVGSLRLGGTMAYLRGLVSTLARYQCSTVDVSIDGEAPQRLEVLFIAVGNTPFYGGGMCMVPHAVPDDGVLDLCVCGALSRFETLKSLPLVYSGKHTRHPKVSFRKVRTLTVRSDQPLTVQADGEIIGASPVTFGVAPSVLRIVAAKTVARAVRGTGDFSFSNPTTIP